jgi:hypothetical protein
MLRRVAFLRTDISKECVTYVFLRSVLRLLITANVRSSQALSTLMMEAIRPSETLVFTRTTRHNFQEDDILQIFVCLGGYLVKLPVDRLYGVES